MSAKFLGEQRAATSSCSIIGRVRGIRDQERLRRYVDSAGRAQAWDELYEAETLEGVVHRDRQALALTWIDRLALPARTSVLDMVAAPGARAVEVAAALYASLNAVKYSFASRISSVVRLPTERPT